MTDFSATDSPSITVADGVGQARQPVGVSHVGDALRLTGDRNQCQGCKEYFNSSFAFDKHRTGDFGKDRRCLTVAEMQAKGMSKNVAGFWISAAMPTDVHAEESQDLQREVAILLAGRDIETAMARYAESGCFADRGAADAARLRMEELIRGRSPAVVARMEEARGIR